MIPLKDDNPTRHQPVVTLLFIAANIAIYFFVQQGPNEFLASSAADQVEDIRFNFEHAAIPDEVTTGEPLDIGEVAEALNAPPEAVAAQLCEPGADSVDDACFPDKNVWLALLSSMFLHGGLLHLFGNMLFLWIFGNNIEDHMGVVRFIGFYLLGGVVASIAHVAVQTDSAVPVVGASGAIAAVMGAYLVWFPEAPIKTIIIFYFILFRDISAKWLLGFWFVSQFFDVVNPNSGVAWMAHVGGFVFGALVALVVKTSQGARDLMWRDTYARARGPDDWYDGGFGDRGWER